MRAYIGATTSMTRGVSVLIPYAYSLKHIVGYLNIISNFGGVDTDTGVCFGWEIDIGLIQRVRMMLALNGYRVVGVSVKNYAEIYP